MKFYFWKSLDEGRYFQAIHREFWQSIQVDCWRSRQGGAESASTPRFQNVLKGEPSSVASYMSLPEILCCRLFHYAA
jgi:hypothetical protein